MSNPETISSKQTKSMFALAMKLLVKPPHGAAVQFVQSAIGADEPTLQANDTSFLPFVPYDPAGENYLLEGDPILNTPLQAYRIFGGRRTAQEDISSPRFCLVLALNSSIEFQRCLTGGLTSITDSFRPTISGALTSASTMVHGPAINEPS